MIKTFKSTIVVIIFALFGLTAAGDQARGASSAAQGYVLNMYHFNIQYVAGNEKSYHRIIKQSFEPLLDFYLKHPGWGADFELQGLMVEFIAENYPAVLEKLHRLVSSGQIDLVSFHYSDQLVLAFPAADEEWSIRINDEVLKKYDLKRSGVVFMQEGQFGEGICDMARRKGYNAVVMVTNQYAWFQEPAPSPYYTCRGIDIIESRTAEMPSGIKVKWSFLGDGENVATGGFSPYFPGLFSKKPYLLWLLGRRYKNFEKQGYKIAKVSEFLEALHQAGERPAELKPILDTPWRPNDDSGVFQWMGKYVTNYEKDYQIRTDNWRTRAFLIDAERKGLDQALLTRAWRELLDSEVSDSTGWHPMPAEIRYSDEHNAAALTALGAKDQPQPEGIGITPVLVPVNTPPVSAVLEGPAGEPAIKWSKVAGQNEMWVVDVSWKKKGNGKVNKGLVSLSFPLSGDKIEYSPALLETEVRTIGLGEIKGKPIHLALTNGLIGLGNGLYLIRDNRAGVLSAMIDMPARQIRFQAKDATEDAIALRFFVLRATPEKALEWANRINFVMP